jgi:hypothetical protein
MVSQGLVPGLIVSQRVVDKMVAAAKQYLEDETGEAMVGLVVAPEEKSDERPVIVVLDTISADEEAIRAVHTFQQGGEWQEDVFLWLRSNWDAYRRDGLDGAGQPLDARFNAPLLHPGDWHKQPGHMIYPSGGDLMTALDVLDTLAEHADGTRFMLVPILTLGYDPESPAAEVPANALLVPAGDGTALRIDWWYIHHDSRVLQPILPTVMPAEALPTFTPYPWHLLDQPRLRDEISALQADGLFTFLITWDEGGRRPLSICLPVVRQSWDHVLILATSPGYPQEAPRVYLAPYLPIEDDIYAWFAKVWRDAKPAPAPDGWRWSADERLLDVVRAWQDGDSSGTALSRMSDHAGPAPQEDV